MTQPAFNPVGLLFAYSSQQDNGYACPIPNVLAALAGVMGAEVSLVFG